MSDAATKKMIDAYFEEAPAPMFLASFFRTRPGNFHNSEMVEIDIQRDTEKLALVLQDCNGYNVNDNTIFTNKEFKPPVLGEKMEFEACKLLSRDPGDNPFEDKAFQVKATARVLNGTQKLQPMINRTIELQASTILQTGICSLPGSDGSIKYTLNYQPKPSHFPTVANAWGGGSEDKIADIENQAAINRKDGKKKSDILIFGRKAWQEWIKDDAVKALLDNRRMDMGMIDPTDRAEDATFQGFIWIGNYRFEMWTYEGYYEDPANPGTLKEYVDPNKVIVMSSTARLDASFGNVPRFVPPTARALGFIPSVLRSTANRMGMFLNAWFTPDGETLAAGVKARPLLIPVAIDSFSCIDTNIA